MALGIHRTAVPRSFIRDRIGESPSSTCPFRVRRLQAGFCFSSGPVVSIRDCFEQRHPRAVRAHAALQDDKESVVDSSSPKDGSSGGSRRRARRYDVKDSDGPSNRSNRPESGRTKSASIPTSGKNEATGGRPIPSPVPSPAASSVNTSVGKRDDRTTWEDEEDNVLRRTLSQPLPGMSREAWRALKSGIVPGEFDHALAVATAYSRYNIPWAAQEHAAVHCLRSAVDGQRGWARAET